MCIYIYIFIYLCIINIILHYAAPAEPGDEVPGVGDLECLGRYYYILYNNKHIYIYTNYNIAIHIYTINIILYYAASAIRSAWGKQRAAMYIA